MLKEKEKELIDALSGNGGAPAEKQISFCIASLSAKHSGHKGRSRFAHQTGSGALRHFA